jgi:hypothetical protein
MQVNEGVRTRRAGVTSWTNVKPKTQVWEPNLGHPSFVLDFENIFSADPLADEGRANDDRGLE